MKRRINANDTVLTLTSGGCNGLNLLIHGAGEVVSVDCNPAQSALLELKAVAIKQLEFEDVWQMFGEGVHPRIEDLYERKLAPFLSETSAKFWSKRLWYFKHGLYYQGGMGKLCWVLQSVAAAVGLGRTAKRIANAPTIEEQRALWDGNLVVHFVKNGPAPLVWLFCKFISLVLFNKAVLWFGGGVPGKQYALIKADGLPIEQYIARTMDGVAEHSHVRKSNYFYYNCLTGRCVRAGGQRAAQGGRRPACLPWGWVEEQGAEPRCWGHSPSRCGYTGGWGGGQRLGTGAAALAGRGRQLCGCVRASCLACCAGRWQWLALGLGQSGGPSTPSTPRWPEGLARDAHVRGRRR